MKNPLAFFASHRSWFSHHTTSNDKIELFGTFEGVFLPTLLHLRQGFRKRKRSGLTDIGLGQGNGGS
jgi:hypothetical protein